MGTAPSGQPVVGHNDASTRRIEIGCESMSPLKGSGRLNQCDALRSLRPCGFNFRSGAEDADFVLDGVEDLELGDGIGQRWVEPQGRKVRKDIAVESEPRGAWWSSDFVTRPGC